MANLKDELKNISSDVDSLLSIAQKNSNVSEEQLHSINNFCEDVVYALESSSDITADRIDDLKYELASLQNDLAKAIGLAGVMFYKGQELHADAIKKAGTERATSNILRGIFTYAGIALGADILGSHLKSGLENSADKIAFALKYSNLTKEESSKIGILILILVVLTSVGQDSVPFKGLSDRIYKNHDDKFKDTDEIQSLLLWLISDGVLIPDMGSDLSQLNLNSEHQKVNELLLPIFKAVVDSKKV